MALVDAGSFSRAAAHRNVTQPAFSRRIQMLEDWLGLELVERGSYQLRLTRTGTRFEARLRGLVARIYALRSEMRADASAAARLSVAAQHALMLTHLPGLLRHLQGRLEDIALGIRAGNLEECVNHLSRGEADLLLCFEHPGEPAIITNALRLRIGCERLIPVCAPGLYTAWPALPGPSGPLKLLSYPPDSFLGRLIQDQCLGDLTRERPIEVVCESAFAAGLKEMALAGMGMAWLPLSLVSIELADGRLEKLDPEWSSPVLHVALYRLEENTRPALNSAWKLLEDQPLEMRPENSPTT